MTGKNSMWIYRLVAPGVERRRDFSLASDM